MPEIGSSSVPALSDPNLLRQLQVLHAAGPRVPNNPLAYPWSPEASNIKTIVLLGDSIWKYDNPNRYSIAVEGTSIDADTFGPGWSWPEMLASRIGADGVFNFAQGSTGYLSNNNGTKTNMLDRLPALVATGADLVILGGPHNDSSFTQEQQQNQYALYLNSALSQMPNTQFLVSGCLPLQGEAQGVGSALYNAESYLFSVVDQINNQRLTKLPILTGTPWITGTGSGDTPANNGNMDKYYTHAADHPNTKANFYFSQRYAAAVKSLVNRL